MGVTELVEEVVCKVVDHVHKQIKTNKANRKLRKDVEASVARAVRAGKSPYEEEFRDASLQEVLAMSVDGVYYRDHSGVDLNFIVKPLVEGEYEVDERMAHFTSNLYWSRLPSISEEEEKAAGIKHYVRRPRNPSASAPRLIIAIRGTKLSSVQDLVDDVRISMSTLGFSSRLKQGEDLVKKIIQAYTNWQREDDDDDYSSDSSSATEPATHTTVSCDVCNMCPIVGPRFKSTKKKDYDLCQECFQEHGALKDYFKIEKPLEGTSSSGSAMGGDIYITGHSLGAALALQIGKKLAAEENQRYNVHCFNPPFLTIVELIQEGIFISKAKQMLRKSPLEPLINVASHVKSLTKLTVAMMMDNEEQLVTEVKHFMNLIDWVPVLYINAHDNFCNRFKKHYKLKQKVSAGFEVSSQALVSQVLGRRAVFSSLVPSVDMRISKLPDDAHAVKNWYRSPRIDKFCQYRLLPGVYFGGLPIHSLAKSILYHPDSDQEEDSEEVTYYRSH